MKIVKGKVISGVKSFSYWMEKLESYYAEKAGMRLFPGTLNVELDQPYRLPEKRIRLEKEEYGGTVSVSIVACRIFECRAFILRTDQAESEPGHHSKSVIEIACDVKLRDQYKLKDGDSVEVEVPE